MTREQALAIIENEHLAFYNWFDDSTSSNEIVILQKGGQWVVYSTGERGGIEGIEIFNSEDDALDSFIRRLRAMNRFMARCRLSAGENNNNPSIRNEAKGIILEGKK